MTRYTVTGSIDIFDTTLAHRLEAERKLLVFDLVVHIACDADTAGLSEAFEAHGKVDADHQRCRRPQCTTSPMLMPIR